MPAEQSCNVVLGLQYVSNSSLVILSRVLAITLICQGSGAVICND